MEALLKLNDCSVPSEELSVQPGITLQFLISGSGLIPSGLHFALLSLRPTRMGTAEFFPRSRE